MVPVDPGQGWPPRRVPRRDLAVFLVALAVLLAGALTGGVLYATRATAPTAAVTLTDHPGDLGATTSATEVSLEQYWDAEMPATYHHRFTDLRGGFQPKTPDSPPFPCGGHRRTYRDIRGNAFYCPADDYIAWDAAQLFPGLDRTFGNVAPAIVLAHEMGHAVQTRAGVTAASLIVELQADCFAGSWARFAQSDSTDPVSVADGALDSAVRAILVLRDRPGTPGEVPQAHGLGFDRVNAFQTGYAHGAPACAGFPTEGVLTTELPFRTAVEAATGGNEPYEVALPLLTESLDRFWTAGVPTITSGRAFVPPVRRPVAAPPLPPCSAAGAYDPTAPAGYCPADNSATWADDLLRRVHTAGDLVTGTVLSDVWGRAAQAQAGLPLRGVAPALQRDCFTGAWVASVAGGDTALFTLSPGDVDEALATVLAVEEPETGGAFERAEALRIGILHGLAACA
jgi:predicted metalloprotease